MNCDHSDGCVVQMMMWMLCCSAKSKVASMMLTTQSGMVSQVLRKTSW